MIAGGPKPAAVVIVNPASGRLAAEAREEVVTSLAERFRLEAASTIVRDAARRVAAAAAAEGADLVIAFGGDGHVNEVVNGIAGTNTALGIIPGGTMNVFARALRIPLEPRAAVDHLTERLAAAPRKVSLGKMDGRFFTFSAGCGFDAEAAAFVEEHWRSKRRWGQAFFYWSAFRVLTGSYRHRNPSMVLHGRFGRVPVAMAIACNCGPYAYLAGRSVRIAPQVRLDGGLDVFALRSMRIEALPVYMWRAAIDGDITRDPAALYEHDLASFSLESSEPFARHVDGEPLDPATSAHFEIAPDALVVRA